MKTSLSILAVLCCSLAVLAQKQPSDTLLMTAKNIQVTMLKPGNKRYLVYFHKGKNAPASDLQLWNIKVEHLDYNGKAAISVQQTWDYKDTVVHTATSICDKSDFHPLYHESWWKGRGSSSYNPQTNEVSMNGALVKEGDPSKKNAAVLSSFQSSFNQYYLNWHLDLETFSMLPLRKNLAIKIPFYEFGYRKPSFVVYTVSGEAELENLSGKKIPCWLLSHKEPGNVETFWIDKESKEVLKLEQVVNDSLYRYKVKLPF